MTRKLSKKQSYVLNFIAKYILDHGKAPTVPEIKEAIKVKSLRSVTQYLEILERNGFVHRDRYAKRGIKLIGWQNCISPELIQIPLVGAAGCDNQAVLAEPTCDEFISVSRKYLEKRVGEIIAIRAEGSSMIDANINDGDIVLVERTNDIKSGDRVAVVIDNIAVIKKIVITENSIILKPESKDPTYKPILLDKDFKIYGKVIEVIMVSGGDDTQFVPDPS